MKTIMKIGVILSVLFFTLGLGSIIASVALGATWHQFANALDNGEFLFSSGGLTTRHSSSDTAIRPGTDSSRQYYSDVDSLKVELKRGVLEIVETDEDDIYVEISSDSPRSVQSFMEGDTLKITADSQAAREKNCKVRIGLPEDEYFDRAQLDIGAATVSVENLEADDLQVNLGAGTFNGTGEILSEKSEWEIGVGELTLAYLECGNTSIDCGMGTVSLTLSEYPEDYDCDITCGAGDVSVGNNHFSIGHHQYAGDDADGKLEIQCGMGTVDVKFDEE